MAENMGMRASEFGPITNIRPSDANGSDIIPMATQFGYDCHGFKDYLGNVGLRLAMKNYTAQRRLWLPSVLRPKLGARRFGLLAF